MKRVPFSFHFVNGTRSQQSTRPQQRQATLDVSIDCAACATVNGQFFVSLVGSLSTIGQFATCTVAPSGLGTRAKLMFAVRLLIGLRPPALRGCTDTTSRARRCLLFHVVLARRAIVRSANRSLSHNQNRRRTSKNYECSAGSGREKIKKKNAYNGSCQTDALTCPNR